MSNGQAEIERLEAATSAFEEIITTENDTVDVPNVGTTPSLKKRVEDGLDQRVPGPQVYMQSKPSQLDEYGYPLKTLYKNGDGFITYYPAYAVFRKDGGAWEYVTPHLRNVGNFNGTTQYATAPRVSEINLDDPNLEFEIEWEMTEAASTSNMCIVEQEDEGKTAGHTTPHLYIRVNNLIPSVFLGGVLTTFTQTVPVTSVCAINVDLVSGHAHLNVNGVDVETRAVTVGSYRAIAPILQIAARTALVSFFKGQLSNIKIWTGGDRNTGTLTRHYRMDEGWRGDNNQVLVNYATELGEDVMPNAQVFPNNGTAELNGDIYTITRTGEPSGGYVIANGLGRLKPYLYSVSTTEINNSLQVRDTLQGGFPPENSLPAPNTDYVGLKAPSETADTIVFTTSSTGEFSAILKQADGYGTYIGLTEASWTEETV